MVSFCRETFTTKEGAPPTLAPVGQSGQGDGSLLENEPHGGAYLASGPWTGDKSLPPMLAAWRRAP